MGKILLLAGVSLACFVGGLVGSYFVIPVVDPVGAEQARLRADSLVHALHLADLPMDSLAAGEAIVLAEAIPVEALPEGALPEPDSTATPAEATPTTTTPPAGANAESAALQAAISQMDQAAAQRTRPQMSEAQLAQVQALGNALTKLEDRELRAILARLDLDTLDRLYAASNARNQGRLLQNMPPERAAILVQRAVTQPAATPSAPARPGR